MADQLRGLARDVRRIGRSGRGDPESVAIDKDDVAHRLARMARAMEVANA
jgi:hypothetical protein